MHRLILVFALASLSLIAATVSREQAGEAYGIDNIVLENDQLRVVVSPHNGGRIISLKTLDDQHEFVHWQADEAIGGVLALIPKTAGYPGPLGTLTCAYNVLDEGDDTAAVTLTMEGSGQFPRSLHITRYLRLRDGQRRLEANISIQNKSFLNAKFGLWIHNYTTLPATKETGRGYISTSTGIDFRPAERVTDLTAGWLALIDPASRTGLVGQANYDQLAWLSFWPSASGSTMEWAYADTDLPPGATWQTAVSLMPVPGLESVDMVTTGVAASLDENSLTIYQSDAIERTYLSGDQPILAAKQIGLHEVDLPDLSTPLSISTKDSTLPLSEPRASDGRMEPPAKRPPPLQQSQVEPITLDTPVEATHTEKLNVLVLSYWDYGNAAWGKPDRFPEIAAYVKPAVLSAHDYPFYFGQIIYSQRWAFQARESLAWFLRDDQDVHIDVAYETDFLERLVKLYDYNVLVINDFPADALAPYIEDLRAYVAAGHGLLMLGGYQAYGGWGEDFGNWRALAPLLPVDIVSTPDATDQTPYREDTWHTQYPQHRAMARPNVYGAPYDLFRIGPWVTSMNTWHRSEWRWLNSGNAVELTEAGALHAVSAGVDWAAITPSYHRVKAKPTANVLATIGGHPLLVEQPIGEGRVLASMISDERRLYFWPDSRRFFGQAIRWLAGQKRPVLQVEVTGDRVAIQTNSVVDQEVRLTIIGEDFRRYAIPQLTISAAQPGAALLPTLPPMEYSLEADSADSHATTSFERATGQAPDEVIVINFHNRHVFLQGETVTFDLMPGATHLLIHDSHGRTMSEKNVATPGAQSIKTASWALGDYALTVTSPAGLAVERFCLAREQERYVSLTWADLPVYNSSQYLAAYAAVSRAQEYGATTYSLAGGTHLYGIADTLLKAGMTGVLRSGQASYSAPMTAKTEQFITTLYNERMRTWAKYPALHRIFIDDEGTSYYWKDWSMQATGELETRFQKTYGRPLRQYPETKQQKVDLATYFDETYNWLVDKHSEAMRQVRADWECRYVLSPEHGGLLGTYGPSQFDHADMVEMDGYPSTVGEIGECFLLYTRLRTLAQRLGKPAYAWLGEYRNQPDSIRMQHWLFMANGLANRRWYSSGGGERTGLYRREVIETIAPADRLLKRLGPLASSWQIKPARIGLVMPRDALAYSEKADKLPWEPGGTKQSFKPHTYGSAYADQLEDILRQLHDVDLYADIISSRDLADGACQQYDAFIVTYLDEWLPETITSLQRQAEGKPVFLAKSKQFDRKTKLPGAMDLTDANAMEQLLQLQPPAPRTPQKDVYSHLLEAGEGHWLVIYNHHRQARSCTAILPAELTFTQAIDLETYKSYPLQRTADGLRLTTNIGNYDGQLLWLTTDSPPSPVVTSIEQTGTDHSFTLQLAPTPSPIVVQMTVTDPQGQKALHGDSYLLGPEGLTLTRQLGTNAIPGTWTITLTHVFTSTSRTHTIVVTN